ASDAELREAASKIGFPVMLKASAGGGGRGMRIVSDPAQFENELAVAKDEALKGFGNDAMMVEKLVVDPKHVEVQFAADAHGNVVCLFERECSIQRRHQKLIEEAPSPYPGIAALWPTMRDSVSNLVREAGYQGVGTAEFMLDGQTGNVYFLEVNARLQVEHCVTEEITDLDLVALQISIAEGKPINLRSELMNGDRSGIGGHSIEVRIVAEDPTKGFLPSIGKIIGWAEPKGPGIRVETGFGKGSEISRFYDSMIAKVVAHGSTREAARQRLIVALQDFHVLGVQTNIGYLIAVLSHDQFIKGDVDTGFLARAYSDFASPAPTATIAAIASRATSAPTSSKIGEVRKSVWNLGDDWRVFSTTR
ncbi:MAG TPA: ATP-grasp domain-containing protein, partial [Fimbriimonas sp.]|nr:ATP-grasp domain-containing protein [Fimbriimonas sp.]